MTNRLTRSFYGRKNEISERTPKGKEKKCPARKEKEEEIPHQGLRIFKNLKEAELRFFGNNENLIRQLPDGMRAILIDWLQELTFEYEMNWQTLLITVNIIDRFLRAESVPELKLQLLGVAALFIAAKYEEIHPPSVNDMLYFCDCSFELEELIQQESDILTTLGWNICSPTPLDFLQHYLFESNNKMVDYMAEAFVDVILQEVVSVQHLPSRLAAAAYLLSLLYNDQRNWNSCLEKTGFPASELLNICRMINRHYALLLNRQTYINVKKKREKQGKRLKSYISWNRLSRIINYKKY